MQKVFYTDTGLNSRQLSEKKTRYRTIYATFVQKGEEKGKSHINAHTRTFACICTFLEEYAILAITAVSGEVNLVARGQRHEKTFQWKPILYPFIRNYMNAGSKPEAYTATQLLSHILYPKITIYLSHQFFFVCSEKLFHKSNFPSS